MGKKTKKPSEKKKPKEKKINPFELKFNRVKHTVLGKKLVTEVGRPGLSRKRAHELREKTLGVEHDRIGKVNKIVDKRIGESDETKTLEEKASMRFTAERVKNYKGASKFNLNDDDDRFKGDLTHGGEALTEIQKYEKTLLSDDDDDEPGNLGADVVRMAHFGGGEDPNKHPAERSARKDMIADLIARTKQARYEKQTAKDEIENITDSLDDKYARLLGKVTPSFRPIGSTKAEAKEKDDYDNLALTMRIEADAKATPAERKKTETEEAAEQVGKLERMEQLRLARMNAKRNEKSHIPADVDVDPDAAVGKAKKPKRFELRFDESGQMIEKEKAGGHTVKKVAADSDDSMTESEEEDEDEEELDDLLGDDDEEGDDDDEDDDEDDDDEDGDDAEGEEENEEEDDEGDSGDEAHVEKKHGSAEEADNVGDADIPFVFEMPKNYTKFSEFVIQFPPDKLKIVVDRLMKCHHPGLKAGNKKLLAKLFLFLLRFFDETAKQTPNKQVLTILGSLTTCMYEVMKFDVEHSARCVRALIRQFWRRRIDKAKRSSPSFGLIALLRLVATLFPVSDRWHPVCTPAFMMVAHTITDVQITSLTVLSRLVLLATVVGDFVEESKRYVPEVMMLLRGALQLAVATEKTEVFPSVSFPVSLPHRHMIVPEEKVENDAVLAPLSLSQVFSTEESETLKDTPDNRCRVLRALVAIIQKFRVIYAVHEYSFTAMFTPFVGLLKRISLDKLPECLREEIEALTRSTEAECKAKSRLTQISRVKTEKSMMKMLEPKFEENFDPDRPRMGRDPSRHRGPDAENKKMQHMLKKERRGAIKTLRRDSSFLARKERKEQGVRDRDRTQKTKRLMSGLQTQQAEWNQERSDGGKKRRK